eukprot:12364545-Heterocapsa_arctica.AAC.1
MIVDTRSELRELLKAEFNIDPSVSISQPILQAALVEAWEAAVQRSAKSREEEALQRAARLPR